MEDDEFDRIERLFVQCLIDCTIDFMRQKGPASYHMVARGWNWDNDLEVLEWIVSQEDCDKGTAQIVFELAEPWFYKEDEREADGSFGIFQKTYDLILKIARNWERGFYKTWQFSEATVDGHIISPIRGSRQINNELTVPAGLDEKGPGATRTQPSSQTIPTDGEEFFEGIPASVDQNCRKMTGFDKIDVW